MFKSRFIARKEIVRVLPGFPSLHRAGLVEVLFRAIKARDKTFPDIAFEFDCRRAPIAPLKAATTEFAGPDIRNVAEPDPWLSTPCKLFVKSKEVAFVWPQINKVSGPDAWICGKKTE